MAKYTQTVTFANGNTADGGELNTEIVNLGTAVNSINQTQLDLTNNAPIQVANASGTEVDVLKLGSDNYVVFSQIPDHTRTSGGTFSTTTKTDQAIIRGCFWVQAASATNVDGPAITLPITMADTNYSVLFSAMGTKSTLPSGRDAAFDGNAEIWVTQIKTGTKTTTGFTPRLYRSAGGNFSGTTYMITEFVVIGQHA